MNELIVTTSAVADLLGVSTRTIAEWNAAGMPKVKHGRYDLKVVMQWWLDNVYDGGDSDTSLSEAKRRYWTAKAEKESISAQQLRETLVDVAEVARAWTDRVVRVTSGLDNLTDRLPPLLVGKGRDEIHAILKDEIRALRTRYAEYVRHCPATEEVTP